MPLTKWELKGDYFEACNCDVACPCIFSSYPPPDGHCTVIAACHFDSGRFDDTRLDGLNAFLAVDSPGPMDKVKWKAALYIDSKANKAQSEALEAIFTKEQAGGLFAKAIGEYLGSKRVGIQYAVNGKTRSVKIQGIANVEVDDFIGPNGKPTEFRNAHGLAPDLLYVAKSKRLKYKDHGMNWQISDKNSYHAPFSWKGP
jgi:hypothetical protein